jgi:hypothetical protein
MGWWLDCCEFLEGAEGGDLASDCRVPAVSGDNVGGSAAHPPEVFDVALESGASLDEFVKGEGDLVVHVCVVCG